MVFAPLQHSVVCDMLQAEEFVPLVKKQKIYNVQHPLLDKVRACSAEPEIAAAFFGMLLWPGENRVSALRAQQTPYLKDVWEIMREAMKEQNFNGKPRGFRKLC